MSPQPAYYRKTAEKLAERFKPEEPIPLGQAEAFKRNLQRQAKKEYQRVGADTEMAEARKGAAHLVKQSIYDAVETAGKSPNATPEVAQAAKNFAPANARLGRLIEAKEAAERGAARVAQRSFFGLPEIMAAVAGMGQGMASHGMTGGGLLGLGAGLAAKGLRTYGPSLWANTAPALGRGLNSAAKSELSPALAGLLGDEAGQAMPDEELRRAKAQALRNRGGDSPP